MASTSQLVLSNNKLNRRNWSDLPPDLLESISTNLSFSDLSSLKGVWSSWRAITKGINMSQLVFFSMYHDNILENPDNHNKVLLFGINKGRQCTLNNPFGMNNNYTINDPRFLKKYRGMYCDDDKVVGLHPDGWLILNDNNGYYFLIELLTLVRIELPKNLKSTKASQGSWRHKAILSDNPNSCQDFNVIMLYGTIEEHKLAFWSNGDSKWRFLRGHEMRKYSDIVWSNGTLYATKSYGPLSVEIWDFNSRSATKKLSIINELPNYDGWRDGEMTKLVVSSSGEILVVCYREKWVVSSTKKWAVYKVDLSEKRCIELDTLNGQALVMVGIEVEPHMMIDNNLFCISSSDVEKYGYKPNSIYIAKGESWNFDTCVRRIKLDNYSLDDAKVIKVWDTIIPIYVKLQPLGLFSLNNSICGRWSRTGKYS